MKFIKTMIVVFTCLYSFQANANETGPFNTVQKLFVTLSTHDMDEMGTLVTEDFQILEAGEVWDLETTKEMIGPSTGGVERRNYFSVIKTKSHGDLVWVSYWNRAEFRKDSELVRKARWLESAVVIKVDGTWKIEMLTSTRLRDDQSFPDDATFEEYVH